METLKFLAFINNNLKEIQNIMEKKPSLLLIEVEKVNDNKKSKKKVKGIVFESSFLSIKTLKNLLKNI